MTPNTGEPTGPSRRRFLTRSLLSGGLLLASPALLTACAGSSDGASSPSSTALTPRAGGSLTFARNADSQTADPVEAGDNEAIWVCSALYERLYQSSADGDTSVPCLATGYTLSADKLSWTFALRAGVLFSDGTPMTSADVKYSIDRCTQSDANGYINVAIKSVEAPDANTVVIHTFYPTQLLGVVSYYANGIVPNKLGGKTEKAFFAQPAGTGAFYMASWQPGTSMVLQRNPHYWQAGLPYLDKITLAVVSDDNSRILQLRGGQADVIESPPWSQFASIKSESGVTVQTYQSTLIDFLSLNMRTPQLADVNVRKAMSLAIDRAAIVRTALFGNGKAAGSMFPPTWPDYDSSIAVPIQDVAGAKAALAASSYPGGFSIKYSVNGGDTVQAATAQLVQSNLAAIGITVKIQQYDANTLQTLVAQGNYEIFHDLLSLDIMDPFEDVPYLVDPSAGGDAAWANYKDAEVIKWSTQASQSADASTVSGLYRQIQQRLASTYPFLALYYAPYAYAMSTKVQQFLVPPTGDYRLTQTWLTA